MAIVTRMHVLPRVATGPKLAAGHVTLTDVAELAPSRVGDDELVTEERLARVVLECHSSQFVEFASLEIAGGSLADSDWYRTNWVDVALEGVDAANASFTESGLKRIAWRNSRLVGIGLSGCTLHDVAHLDCVAQMANFRFAHLQRVEFVDCDLTGADFTNARLQEVSFLGCRLEGATFSHATSDRVLFHGGELQGIRGLGGLRGATIHVADVSTIAQEMAAELGIQLTAG